MWAKRERWRVRSVEGEGEGGLRVGSPCSPNFPSPPHLFGSVQSGLGGGRLGPGCQGCGRFLLSLLPTAGYRYGPVRSGRSAAETVAGRPRELKILQCGLVASPHWPPSCPLPLLCTPCLPLPASLSTARHGMAWVVHGRAPPPPGHPTTTPYIKPRLALQQRDRSREPHSYPAAPIFYPALTPLYRTPAQPSPLLSPTARIRPAGYHLQSPSSCSSQRLC